MRNDEQQPPQGPPYPQQYTQQYTGWSYDQEPQPPMQRPGPSGSLPPEGYYPPPQAPGEAYYHPPQAPGEGYYPPQAPGNAYHPYNLSSGPLDGNNAFPQGQVEPYNPDLTMHMGNSLGYGQSLQYNAISVPQPSQAIPRLRQERLQQLREERMRRQQRRMGPDVTSMIQRKGQPVLPNDRPGSPPYQQGGAGYPAAAPFGQGARSNSAPLAAANLQPATEAAQNTAMIQRMKVARNSSLISGAFMVSSILGLVQTFLFTYIFGRGVLSDAYYQAYNIPNMIYTVIAGGALSSAFIPVFTSYAVKERDEKTAWHIASSALNISVLGMIVFSAIAALLAPIIVPIYTRQPQEVAITVTLTRIMLLQAIVLGSGVIVGAVLNTKQDFTYTALGVMLYNVGLNLGLLPGFLLTFHTRLTSPSESAVYLAAWGVVLGAILQVGVQIPGLFKVKMRYTFTFDWRHPGVIQIGRQMVPRVINALMLSFSTIVDRSLLSLLSTGLINAYVQAFSILLLPVTLFGSSVSTAAFPSLASYASQERFDRVRSIIMETLRGILFLTIPSAVGLLILSFPIAQALLEHGNFDLTGTHLASVVLFFFALGLPGLAAVEILTRSFYALQDSKTPVTISVAQFIFKIALSIILINLAVFGIEWGMGALAFSTSISSTFEAIVLFILLTRRIGNFDMAPFRQFAGRTVVAASGMAVVLFVVQLILNALINTTSIPRLTIPDIFLAVFKVLIELGLGSLTYLVIARLFNMEEMNTGLVRRVIRLLHIPWL